MRLTRFLPALCFGLIAGHGWRLVAPQRAGDGFHRASYFVAIAEGATTVRVRMSRGDSWYRGPFLAGDFATCSR